MALRPQIITKINLNNSYSNLAEDKVAVMVGTSSWGPLNELTSISSVSEFVSKFGDDITGNDLTLIKGADLFLRNGGGLKVVRIAHSGYDKADVTFNNSSTPVLTFTAYYNGTHGNNIQVTITANGSNRDITITDGTITETYNNGGSGYSTNQDIATAINNSSQLVVVTVASGNETTNLVDATTTTYLTGGNNGTASLDITDYTTAIDNVLWNEEFNYLLIPGQNEDSFQNTIAGKLDTRASSNKKYSRYITGVGVDESVSTMSSRTTSSYRISLVAPAVKYYHRYDADYTYLDGSYLACAYTGKMCSLDTEVSMTHESISVDGVRVDSTTNQLYYNKSEQEVLLENRVIPITNISNMISPSRGVTRITDTTNVRFDGVVVDIIDYTTNLVEEYLDTVIGKPQTEERRSLYASKIDAILQGLKREEVIQEYASTQVIEGSSPDSILVDVAIKPSYTVNFVYLTINVN